LRVIHRAHKIFKKRELKGRRRRRKERGGGAKLRGGATVVVIEKERKIRSVTNGGKD